MALNRIFSALEQAVWSTLNELLLQGYIQTTVVHKMCCGATLINPKADGPTHSRYKMIAVKLDPEKNRGGKGLVDFHTLLITLVWVEPPGCRGVWYPYKAECWRYLSLNSDPNPHPVLWYRGSWTDVQHGFAKERSSLVELFHLFKEEDFGRITDLLYDYTEYEDRVGFLLSKKDPEYPSYVAQRREQLVHYLKEKRREFLAEEKAEKEASKHFRDVLHKETMRAS